MVSGTVNEIDSWQNPFTGRMVILTTSLRPTPCGSAKQRE